MFMAIPVLSTSDIPDQRLRRFHEYWDVRRGARVAPAQCDIDPVDIPDLLGHINIYDVRPEPRDFRVRLNGTLVAGMQGQDITGKWCSEIMSGDVAERCYAAFGICVDDRKPALVETSLAFCGKPYGAQLILAAPLSSDGIGVDMMVTVHSYQQPGARAATR